MLLVQLLAEFAGDVAKALASYNWHPDAVSAAVDQYGADWLSHAPAETQNYVQKIIAAVGSEYSVSMPGLPAMSAAGVSGQGFSLTTALWLGGALIAGWLVFSLLE